MPLILFIFGCLVMLPAYAMGSISALLFPAVEFLALLCGLGWNAFSGAIEQNKKSAYMPLFLSLFVVLTLCFVPNYMRLQLFIEASSIAVTLWGLIAASVARNRNG